MTKVVSIQYPSGGFGHFIHVVLSVYSKQFNGQKLEYQFGPGGDSHAYPTQLPKYYLLNDFDVNLYQQQLNNINDEFATILIDSGIDNDSNEFRAVIKSNISIRICYDHWTWPLLAQIFYTRCMAAVTETEQTINQWIVPDQGMWRDQNEPWAIREKFFLYLKDHQYRNSWREDQSTLNIPVDQILSYQTMFAALSSQFELDNFENFYQTWHDANHKHFNFFIQAQHVWKNLQNNIDLTHIDDIFTQAVIYYYIWLEYGIEVPHNDYSNWFTNTQEIVTMLNKHGVLVDTN